MSPKQWQPKQWPTRKRPSRTVGKFKPVVGRWYLFNATASERIDGQGLSMTVRYL